MPNPDLPPVRADLDVLLDTALSTGGETERFDFKELLDLSQDEHKLRLVRAIGAFTNTDEGGFVLVGISDDRRVVGVSDAIAEAYDQTRVHAIAAQYLTPPPPLQVRHHFYQGKKVIVVEVPSFEEIPSVVRQSATFGKERLLAGTFLFRTKAAKSGVLEAEGDVRALCDTLVKRRASSFLDLIQRGALGLPLEPSKAASFSGEMDVRGRADRVWPTSGAPAVEVGFASGHDLSLTPDQMRSLIPGACIPVKHGFPFYMVGDSYVERAASWGWFGRIPMADDDVATPEPSYLWMLTRSGAFLHRDHLWEDKPRPDTPGRVVLYHLLGNLILDIRFLQSLSAKLSLHESTPFRIFIAANNVRGKHLQDEDVYWRHLSSKGADDAIVKAQIEVDLGAVLKSPQEIAIKLIDEMAWQFGRHDLKRQNIEMALKRAPDVLGAEYKLLGKEAGG